jgi:hypothetical protein
VSGFPPDIPDDSTGRPAYPLFLRAFQKTFQTGFFRRVLQIFQIQRARLRLAYAESIPSLAPGGFAAPAQACRRQRLCGGVKFRRHLHLAPRGRSAQLADLQFLHLRIHTGRIRTDDFSIA